MQSLIVVCAMLFVAVTPFLSRYEAADVEWSDEDSGAVLGADVADAADASDSEQA